MQCNSSASVLSYGYLSEIEVRKILNHDSNSKEVLYNLYVLPILLPELF